MESAARPESEVIAVLAFGDAGAAAAAFGPALKRALVSAGATGPPQTWLASRIGGTM